MKHIAWIVLAAALVAGCQPKEEVAATPQPTGAPGVAAGEERSSDDIAIHSPAAGSMAPVTGGENLQGSGGGVANSAKSLAKDVAKEASNPPSDDSTPAADEGG